MPAHHHSPNCRRAIAFASGADRYPLDPSLIEGNREARLDAYRQVRDQLERHILDRFPLVSAGG